MGQTFHAMIESEQNLPARDDWRSRLRHAAGEVFGLDLRSLALLSSVPQQP